VIRIDGNLLHVLLGTIIVSITELISIALLIKERSGDRLFVIYSTHYIDKEILCKRNNALFDVLCGLTQFSNYT
jgi:hypothetical protein